MALNDTFTAFNACVEIRKLTFVRVIFFLQVKNAHRVDLTANLKGLTVHCKEESPDMYTSIDAAATALQSKLRKYRTRRNDGHHKGNSMGDDAMAAIEAMEADLEEDEEFVDTEEPTVMKVNSYDLENAIPIKEAIFALDYVDHDFFAFKNEETGKPSIVYKRNAGGVGLIELQIIILLALALSMPRSEAA